MINKNQETTNQSVEYNKNTPSPVGNDNSNVNATQAPNTELGSSQPVRRSQRPKKPTDRLIMTMVTEATLPSEGVVINNRLFPFTETKKTLHKDTIVYQKIRYPMISLIIRR